MRPHGRGARTGALIRLVGKSGFDVLRRKAHLPRFREVATRLHVRLLRGRPPMSSYRSSTRARLGPRPSQTATVPVSAPLWCGTDVVTYAITPSCSANLAQCSP